LLGRPPPERRPALDEGGIAFAPAAAEEDWSDAIAFPDDRKPLGARAFSSRERRLARRDVGLKQDATRLAAHAEGARCAGLRHSDREARRRARQRRPRRPRRRLIRPRRP
jgi:hypothetical protein